MGTIIKMSEDLEDLSREMGNIKNNPIEILEFRSTVSDIKGSLKLIKRWLEMAKERINVCRKRSMEII